MGLPGMRPVEKPKQATANFKVGAGLTHRTIGLIALATRAEQAHIAAMNTVICQCGAIYERAEQKAILREEGRFSCHVCGQNLESWSASHARKPTFKLVKRPETDTD
jgi:transposase-like protein